MPAYKSTTVSPAQGKVACRRRSVVFPKENIVRAASKAKESPPSLTTTHVSPPSGYSNVRRGDRVASARISPSRNSRRTPAASAIAFQALLFFFLFLESSSSSSTRRSGEKDSGTRRASGPSRDHASQQAFFGPPLAAASSSSFICSPSRRPRRRRRNRKEPRPRTSSSSKTPRGSSPPPTTTGIATESVSGTASIESSF
mmetsp:Transcript_22075/g.71077  ORF Transcript_22075/g.71077 Transcript_22075/m.71077 type:complete len:200 (-) Transcript_22075:210-809(-)